MFSRLLLCESGQSFCAETFILLKTHLFTGTETFQKNRPVLTYLPNDFKTGQQSRFPSKPAWLLTAPSLLSTLWAVWAEVVPDFIPAAGVTLLQPHSALAAPSARCISVAAGFGALRHSALVIGP